MRRSNDRLAAQHDSAYTNSFAGTTSTVLYNLDANSDVLTRQDPPNAGTLVNIGALGLDLSGMAGLDIGGGANGLVLAALRTSASGPYSLYTCRSAPAQPACTATPAMRRCRASVGPAARPCATLQSASEAVWRGGEPSSPRLESHGFPLPPRPDARSPATL